MTGLRVLSAGPAMAVQDLGRPGLLAHGLTQGGATDRLAFFEGAALLGQSPNCAALEMVGTGGTFQALCDLSIALTGAEMRAQINGNPVVWNAAHPLPQGTTLTIGPSLNGTYGYLHVTGGFQTDPILGARAAHLSRAIGALVQTDDILPCSGPLLPAQVLPRDTRFDGGGLRVMPSMQTAHFPTDLRERFTKTEFQRDPRGNRQGIRMQSDGEGFATPSGLSVVSEIIVPGDVQITGDGTPFILLSECQTTGGYPRIGTVLPSDLPKAAQTPAGAALRFEFVSLDEARRIEEQSRLAWRDLSARVTPLVRDPKDMDDLLGHNLISGVTHGGDDICR